MEPITPAALREEARRIRAGAEQQARALEDAALALERTPVFLGPERSHGARVAAGKSGKRWPWRLYLDRAGLSVPEWASKHEVHPEIVKSWLKANGHGGRAIPRTWAVRISEEFNAPELRDPACWPLGIRETR